MKATPRVLVVDDDESLARATAMVLARRGLAVETAIDGEDAVARVQRERFDVALMDIRMPGIDGLEAMRRIRAITQDVKVILMTAYAQPDVVAAATAEGAVAVLTKPLDMAWVTELVSAAYRHGRGALILLVDDDPSVCDVLRRTLEGVGYRVTVAHDSGAALVDFQKERTAAVLLDMKLQNASGLETLAALQKIDPAVVAVGITGYGQELGGLIARALDRGLVACLEKPLHVSDMLDTLRQAIVSRAGGAMESGALGG